MTIPSGQIWLDKRMKEVGYQGDTVDSNTGLFGLCFGVAHMAMHAILLQEILIFEKRLELIAEIDIDEFKEKIKNGYEEKNELSDILQFFDGIEMYQNSDKYEYGHLFDRQEYVNITQTTLLPVIPIVQPQKLEEKGGLIMGKGISGIYNSENLKIYFETLKETIKQKKIEEPIALVLNSSNHSITISYDSKTESWIFVDPDRLPYHTYNDDEIADQVLNAFSENQVCTFYPEIYATGNLELDTFIKDWEKNPQFLEISNVDTKLKINEYKDDQKDIKEVEIQKCQLLDSDNTSLLFTAAGAGDKQIVLSLLKYDDVNINELSNGTYSALYVAVQEGHKDIVKELIQHHKINLHQVKIKSALTLASKSKYKDIEILLLDKMNEIKLDQSNDMHKSPYIDNINESNHNTKDTLSKNQKIEILHAPEEEIKHNQNNKRNLLNLCKNIQNKKIKNDLPIINIGEKNDMHKSPYIDNINESNHNNKDTLSINQKIEILHGPEEKIQHINENNKRLLNLFQNTQNKESRKDLPIINIHEKIDQQNKTNNKRNERLLSIVNNIKKN